MATYYIQSDGLGGTTSGNGSSGSPYGTLAELDGAVTLSDGDTVYIDTETNGPLLESWYKSSLTGVTFSPWPGTSQVRILNVAAHTINISHDVGGGDPYDTWKGAGGTLGFTPETVLENWDTNVNSDGNRYGFLPSIGTLGDLRTNRGYHYNGSTLLVSVPDGETPVGRTYYAGKSGDTVRLTSPTRVTFNNFSFELATESGAGNGYGLRIVGACADVTLNDCEADGCQYHSIGSVGSGTNGFHMNGCTLRTIAGSNDSHWVAYSSTNEIQNVTCTNQTHYLVPWLGVDGLAFGTAGGVKGIACHHGASADPTQARGVIFDNLTSIWRGHNPTYNHPDIIMTATNTNHAAPSDSLTVNDYPIIIRDSTLGGHGAICGGGNTSDTHLALQRCSLNFDASSVTNGLSTNSHITANCGTSSNTEMLMESCTISAEINDVTARSLTSVYTGGNGPELHLVNCSLYLVGTYTNAVYVIYGASSSGLLTVKGCALDKSDKTSTRAMFSGSIPLASAIDFEDNLYETAGATQMHDTTGTSFAVFKSTYDPDGEIGETDWGYADDDTLEPSAALKALKNSARSSGPNGINNKSYSNLYGAWQYGGGMRARDRSRER